MFLALVELRLQLLAPLVAGQQCLPEGALHFLAALFTRLALLVELGDDVRQEFPNVVPPDGRETPEVGHPLFYSFEDFQDSVATRPLPNFAAVLSVTKL